MKEPNDGANGERRPPGAQPDTLKIDATFEEAVARAMRAAIPPGGIPERPKRTHTRREPAKQSGEK